MNGNRNKNRNENRNGNRNENGNGDRNSPSRASGNDELNLTLNIWYMGLDIFWHGFYPV
jgi:hypothetical protein